MKWLENLATGGLSGIASGIASIFGGIQQNNMIDKQIAAQKEENRLNRDYNMKLAAYQNRMNLAQWQRENEYNSPENQMKRLRAAGLNPDLMYQNGASGLTAASSPAMTAGAASSPTDVSNLANKKTVGQIVTEGLDNAQRAANIALTRAQANKTNAETKGQNLKNLNIFALDRAELENVLADTDLKRSEQKQVLKNIEVMDKSLEQMDASIEQIRTATNDITVQQQFKRFELALKSKEVNANVEALAVQMEFTKAQTDQLKKSLPYILQQLAANVENTEANTAVLFADLVLKNTQIKLTNKQVEQLQQIVDLQSFDLEDERFWRGLYVNGQQGPFGVSLRVVFQGLDRVFGSIGQILSGSVSFSRGSR